MASWLSGLASATCAAIVAFATAPVHAFPIGGPPPQVTVVEYKNVLLNHYFMTAFPDEMAAIDDGAAGPGWMRTGYGFVAYQFVNPWCDDCREVSRFYGTPGLGPNSHFFTADSAEESLLKLPGSGWSLEGIAFSIPVPHSGGQCASGIPVYRLYNGRWMFNDSNHRYVTSLSEREAMIAAGWADEGPRFCALATAEGPLKSFRIDVGLDGNILPSAECEDDRVRTGGCIAVNNLPIPRMHMSIAPFSSDGLPFAQAAGTTSPQDVYVVEPGPASFAAQDVFVYPDGGSYAIHVETHGKAVPALSSVNPLYQFPTAPDADGRFFPWRSAYAFETELSIRWFVSIRKLNARGTDSHAYGHPTLEFIDTASGHHVYFTVLTYGTIPVDQDYLAPDVATGKVIVGTTPRADSPYGRNLGSKAFAVPRAFDPTYYEPNLSGSFDFRVDRAAFGRILASARSVDPALSSNPDAYLLDNFHFNNEVYGDGEIGLSVWLELDVVRR